MSVSDHDLIRNAIAHWPIAVDRADTNLLVEAFMPDAVIHYPAPVGTLHGIGGLEALLKTRLHGVTTYHCLGTQVIQLQSPITATARTYCIGIHFYPGEPRRELRRIYGFFDDSLVKRSDGWRIAERKVIHTYEQMPSNGGERLPEVQHAMRE
ncbi:nuclear transport factor 2 family protein [Aspergillus saccharolyticus JOP 1030-1]|uniref:SnoaL-like domain-containing protein n=1 Tax=Aspergillus saccharolyticus JOP 1030-1 TaxID=1450539 RepID=A0A318ZH66_9EURO|nr:hypothetical protein BP01DRAFT_403953 [Aspergillus saccharolyticus JOP 1030-1]PYH43020.1 hypothetical protein BP01DRAFT_403953 [Aspergillus saccharolyticus JOP 1030-1]